MPISSKVIGPDGLPIPALMRDKRPALLVATIPAQHRHFMMEQFISTDGYENLNVDLDGYGGSGAFIIWNGTGGSDTGGDWAISGDATTASVVAKRTGTYGLDTGIMEDNDNTIFTSSSLIDISQYSFLSYWINAQMWPGESEIDFQWFNGSSKVGDKLHDYDYATVVVGSWVNVKIPIEDFNLTCKVNKLRFKWEKEDDMHAWVDDIELLSSSGGSGTKSSTGVFRISGVPGEVKEVREIRLVINTASSGWESTDFTLIDGGLDAGILFRWWDRTQKNQSDAPTITRANLFRSMKNNLELFGFFDITTNLDFLDSGRLLVLSLDISADPIHLFAEQTIDIVVRDDLSAISSFKAYVIGNRRFHSLQKDELEEGC